jgi:hypothetical protein
MGRFEKDAAHSLLCKAFALGYRVCESKHVRSQSWALNADLQAEASPHVETLVRTTSDEAAPDNLTVLLSEAIERTLC